MSHQNIKWTLHVCRNDTILWVVENEKYELLQFSSEVKIVEKLDWKRENRDSVQDECEDLYAGAGNCTGCPVPDTCLVNTLETGLNIATILLAILGAEQLSSSYTSHTTFVFRPQASSGTLCRCMCCLALTAPGSATCWSCSPTWTSGKHGTSAPANRGFHLPATLH